VSNMLCVLSKSCTGWPKNTGHFLNSSFFILVFYLPTYVIDVPFDNIGYAILANMVNGRFNIDDPHCLEHSFNAFRLRTDVDVGLYQLVYF